MQIKIFLKILVVSIFLLHPFNPSAQQKVNIPPQIKLPNGWSLTPVGKSFPLGDLPLNIAVSSNKKYIAVTNNGQSTQSILLFDVQHEKMVDSIIIAKSWLGLKFSIDNKYLYASGGNDNRI
ncbi:MAG: hypothetical protein ABJB05_14155 [Parafilimonas sp.]